MGMALIGLSLGRAGTSNTPMHKEEVLGMVARAGQSRGKLGVANCLSCMASWLCLSILIHQMGTRVLPSRVVGKDSRRE